MTTDDFTTLKQFLAGIGSEVYMYGYAVLLAESDGILKPIGTYHISNYDDTEDTFKPADYFIFEDCINGSHYTLIGEVQLTVGLTTFKILA